MAWLSRVNFTASDVLSYTDLNNLGNDIRAWGGNVNGGGYTLSNIAVSASSGTMATINGGTGASSTLTVQSTSGSGTSDAIIFKTASQSERMRIDSSGNVSIGNSSNNGTRRLAFTTNTGGSSAIESVTAGATDQDLVFKTTYSTEQERMRITGLGNVGIGTSSPTGKLSVVHDAASVAYGITVDSYNGATFKNTLFFGYNTASDYSYIGNFQNLPISFITNNTERMRIDTSGYLLIGYTSSNGAYRLQVNSQIFATNATIATSDGRYKQGVTSLQSGLDVIEKLNPVTFDWKDHDIHNFESGTQVGFIAQEVKEALADTPYLDSVIKRNELKRDDGSVEEFYGMADAKLIPVLVKAIQELKAEIDLLKSRN